MVCLFFFCCVISCLSACHRHVFIPYADSLLTLEKAVRELSGGVLCAGDAGEVTVTRISISFSVLYFYSCTSTLGLVIECV